VRGDPKRHDQRPRRQRGGRDPGGLEQVQARCSRGDAEDRDQDSDPDHRPDLLEHRDDRAAKLADQGLPLAIAVSTPQPGIERIPDAYREAHTARELLGAAGGVVGLPTLSAFEYMTLIGGDAADRLISDPVRQFVAQDLEDDAVLTDTLLAYVAADLNAKVAAERLHVHVNTMRYRLGRITERTGRDLRRISNLLATRRLRSRRNETSVPYTAPGSTPQTSGGREEKDRTNRTGLCSRSMSRSGQRWGRHEPEGCTNRERRPHASLGAG
jgi:hypothetical protein